MLSCVGIPDYSRPGEVLPPTVERVVFGNLAWCPVCRSAIVHPVQK